MPGMGRCWLAKTSPTHIWESRHAAERGTLLHEVCEQHLRVALFIKWPVKGMFSECVA